MPSELFEEVAAPEEGTRRFENEFPIGGDGRTAIEVVTFDIATGIPLEYSNTGVLEVSVRFRVVDLALG